MGKKSLAKRDTPKASFLKRRLPIFSLSRKKPVSIQNQSPFFNEIKGISVNWKKLSKGVAWATMRSESISLSVMGRKCTVEASKTFLNKMLSIEHCDPNQFLNKTKMLEMVRSFAKTTPQEPLDADFRLKYEGLIKTKNGNAFLSGYFYPKDERISLRISPVSKKLGLVKDSLVAVQFGFGQETYERILFVGYKPKFSSQVTPVFEALNNLLK